MKKYDNFMKALKNLEVCGQYEAPYDVVTQTGLVSLFSICFEQAWKAMKEVLESHGFGEGKTGSPKMILKLAYHAGMIQDEKGWLELLDRRNEAGEADDPRYFAHPDRVHAQIIWFGKGYVEYTIPTLLPPSVQIEQITLSLEISSEAPGVNNDWPSDIYFYLNGENIGMWTSPGDFGDVRGIFTPDWWLPNWNQYGLLKMITINKEGTFVDGLKISNTSIKQFDLDYKSTIRFRFEVPQDAKNVGGLTIFGRKFGNYSQAIQARIAYSHIAVS